MIWTVILVLLALWVLGFIGNVAGSLIHLLLLVAAIVVVGKIMAGRRTV